MFPFFPPGRQPPFSTIDFLVNSTPLRSDLHLLIPLLLHGPFCHRVASRTCWLCPPALSSASLSLCLSLHICWPLSIDFLPCLLKSCLFCQIYSPVELHFPCHLSSIFQLSFLSKTTPELHSSILHLISPLWYPAFRLQLHHTLTLWSCRIALPLCTSVSPSGKRGMLLLFPSRNLVKIKWTIQYVKRVQNMTCTKQSSDEC